MLFKPVLSTGKDIPGLYYACQASHPPGNKQGENPGFRLGSQPDHFFQYFKSGQEESLSCIGALINPIINPLSVMKLILRTGFMILLAVGLVACGGSGNDGEGEKETNKENTSDPTGEQPVNPATSDGQGNDTPATTEELELGMSADSMRRFLHSQEGTYGWDPINGVQAEDPNYDFFPDGRLHIQGPEGEATMWEGKWALEGDQLTLENTDEGTSGTYTIRTDGEFLYMNGRKFKRYKPE